MIFNVLSILGACYVFLTIGEFFYSLIHKIPPLLDRRGGETTTTTTTKTTSTSTTTIANNNKSIDCTIIYNSKSSSSMTDSVDTCNDKELYQSELRKRKRRIATREVKGFLIGDQKHNEIDEDRKILSHDGIKDECDQHMNRSNNSNQNVFGSSSSISSYVLTGQEHWTGDSGVSMVGYYDSPPCGSGGIITAVRNVATQPSPQLSFEVEHHNQHNYRQNQNRQQLKVNYSPNVSHSDSRSSLDLIPVKLLTTNSSSSLASGGSPFKISENSAFRPVHRTPSLDRDTQVSNSSEPIEPTKITIVMRNNLSSTQKAKEAQQTTNVDHLSAPSQWYSGNLGNNERKHSFSSSSPTVWSYDQPGAGSHNHQKPLTSTSKLTSAVGHNVPQTFQHLPDTVTEESVIKLKSTFHDFNKTADGFNPTFGDKQIRPKKDLFSIEKINSVPQLDTYSPLLTPKLLQQTSSSFAHLNNNSNHNKKPDDDIGMALPGALRSAARLHKPSPSLLETSQKTTAFGVVNNQGEIPSFKYPYPECPVKKMSSSPSGAIMGSKSFEEKMFQAMQPSPTLTSRAVMKPSNGVAENAENIAKVFTIDKIKPSENLARWQAEKLEYKKFRSQLSSTSSDKDGQFDLQRDDIIGEQVLFQTDDILKAGNVVAKTKLFETIAESEKQLLDEKDVYKRRSGRKKSDRAHTMLVSPRYLAPELYHDSFDNQMQNDSYFPATTSASSTTTTTAKFGHLDFHQRSPSPLSSSDHEDEKSKMTMIEKAKLFEAKTNNVAGVNGSSSRSVGTKCEDRRKTQPVTQDELAKARTVLVKSIGHSMTGQIFNSSEDISQGFTKVSEYSPRPLPGPRQKNISNVQARFAEPTSKSKPTNAVKPRKTVHLHTDQFEKTSSTISEDDINKQQQARLSLKFVEEETFVNGFSKNTGKSVPETNPVQRSTSHLRVIVNKNGNQNLLRGDSLKRPAMEKNGWKNDSENSNYGQEKSDKVFIDDDSFNALANTPTCILTNYERPKPRRRHSMLNRNNYNKLRESEL